MNYIFAYAALKTTTVNAPTDSDTDENWKLLARGGTSVPVATEERTGVVKASDDVGVSDSGSFFGKIAKAVSTLVSHISTAATTSVLGHVKLTNSVSSTSTSTAAVPTANISQSSAITETGVHVLEAVEKNASIEGTIRKNDTKKSAILSEIPELMAK